MGLKNYQAPILTLAARYLARVKTYRRIGKISRYDLHIDKGLERGGDFASSWYYATSRWWQANCAIAIILPDETVMPLNLDKIEKTSKLRRQMIIVR